MFDQFPWRNGNTKNLTHRDYKCILNSFAEISKDSSQKNKHVSLTHYMHTRAYTCMYTHIYHIYDKNKHIFSEKIMICSYVDTNTNTSVLRQINNKELVFFCCDCNFTN